MTNSFPPPASRNNAEFLIKDSAQQIKKLNLQIKRLDNIYYKKRMDLSDAQIEMIKICKEEFIKKIKYYKEKINYYKNYYPTKQKALYQC